MFALRAATVADVALVLPRTRALNDHEGIATSDELLQEMNARALVRSSA